jgi:hypothetical protein
MNDFENFPTPADIAPQIAPALDEHWVIQIMDEISTCLRKNSRKLQEFRSVRFTPGSRRDMGHAAIQWRFYAKYIADLVREKGWVVLTIATSMEVTALSISAPRDAQPIKGEGSE